MLHRPKSPPGAAANPSRQPTNPASGLSAKAKTNPSRKTMTKFIANGLYLQDMRASSQHSALPFFIVKSLFEFTRD